MLGTSRDSDTWPLLCDGRSWIRTKTWFGAFRLMKCRSSRCLGQFWSCGLSLGLGLGLQKALQDVMRCIIIGDSGKVWQGCAVRLVCPTSVRSGVAVASEARALRWLRPFCTGTLASWVLYRRGNCLERSSLNPCPLERVCESMFHANNSASSFGVRVLFF